MGEPPCPRARRLTCMENTSLSAHDAASASTTSANSGRLKRVAVLMISESTIAYYNTLKRELNPTVFVTEWMSYKLWDVELAMHGSADEVISQCISGIKDFAEARSYSAGQIDEWIDGAPAQDLTKSEFRRAFTNTGASIESQDVEALTIMAVYCFLQIAFDFD